MSNETILDRLLNDIEEYDASRKNRDAFADRFATAIEALEGIPYSVIRDSRDWQHRIEMEGYFDEEGFESENEVVIPKLKSWVNELKRKYS
ncbi:hypothetical protein MIB92_12100 [Aestuariirhabdus sp. Z084]|uniref:hypothetical protein n=1 Tax=Aestuariirhabdus haliotis TaxID=2918751 RepID=UPI00201B3BCD|nr:hypothetical protein [Aestuariirhabdus haliotis]MCL6416395.1 hypothetical protein [Aestuariirhabdus haliotis]MCL6420439.1 hypothetical protein [Aestuariirhabdus haliotis]